MRALAHLPLLSSAPSHPSRRQERDAGGSSPPARHRDRRVQGVFFRDSCRKEALPNGLAGWVRNRSDGAVEAVLEGEPAAVENMVAWMRSGPRAASVEALDVRAEEPAGERGFSVL